MTTSALHPAIVQLWRLQSRGRGRRTWGRFCKKRRLFLSVIACALAVVWLGNAALTIFLRETASPETLRALLSLGLVLYAGWHFTRSAFFRPTSPFDWSPEERELLFAMPLRARDLVAYQLASVTVTTIFKAGLVTLLLLPDLRSVPMGLVGVLLAMLLLEMLRMAIEIATWGMGRAAFLAYRVTIVAGLVAGGFAIGAVILGEYGFGDRIDFNVGHRQRLLDILVRLSDSVFQNVALPFQPFIDLILADSVTASKVALAATATAAVAGLAAAVIGLYVATSRGMAIREKYIYATNCAQRELFAGTKQNDRRGTLSDERGLLRLPRIPRWGGAGALAWRQLVGACRHSSSLLVAMIAPAIFASSPMFIVADPFVAFLATTGTLAFYTFLLLPTALRFDFRRDLDRLATLKTMPITPAAAVIGQTLAPVLIASLFQSVVLGFAIAVKSLPPHHFVTAMLVMIPLNVLVFGLDNLIYLLYPYRVQQEGLEIFLRTMLTFTGKGLLFTGGLVAMSAWGFAAAALTSGIAQRMESAIVTYCVFIGGMIAGSSLLASLVLYGLCRTYRNINPIEDVPR
jgi:hypothetical protein